MSNTYQPESLHPYIMNDRLKKATGSGGITTIPIASTDNVGVVKIGDGISVDADGTISGIPYSTTEYKTGRKWIDGKDIYEKVVALDTPLTVSKNGSNTGITPFHDIMIDVKGNASNGACINFMEYIQNDTINLACSNDFAVDNIIFTFTKPTP